MSTTETLQYDADMEIRSGHLETCPKCSCRSLVTTQELRATRIDPACSSGYCACREGEMVSVCCGAREHPEVENFCSACNDGTGFERECDCTYDWG